MKLQPYSLLRLCCLLTALMATTLGHAQSGCTDALACNYDAAAVTDDGSCDTSCHLQLEINTALGAGTDFTFGVAGASNFTIDWGDGAIDSGQTSSATHTYALDGTYTVRVNGTVAGISMVGHAAAKVMITDISQWGTMVYTDWFSAFDGCSNLATFTATDAPQFALNCRLWRTFHDCVSLDANINHWDVSNISRFTQTFDGCTVFNSPINDWDVTNSDYLDFMFRECDAFVQPLDNWDVSSVERFDYMFAGCQLFNSDITGWDMTGAERIDNMFNSTGTFNQDLSDWDVSNITHMQGLFQSAQVWNHDLSAWNIESLGFADGLFLNAFGLSSYNYDQTLIAFANHPNTPTNVLFRFQAGNFYCESVAERDALINTYNWVFNQDAFGCQEYGCSDVTACNYSTQVTYDTGICEYASGCDYCSGETDGTGMVVDGDTDNDGICNDDEIPGCTDSDACNYNAAATDDDGSCLSAMGCDFCSGETDGSGTVIDGDSDDDGTCDVDEVPGCTDPTAVNYNPAATDEDGSCSFSGCMNPEACNYEPLALEEDYSCLYAGDACDDGDAGTANSMYDSDCNCVGVTLSGLESETDSDYPAGQYTMCEKVKADWVSGASAYRFRFVPQAGGLEVVHVSMGSTVAVIKNIDGLTLGDYTLTVDAGWDVGADTPFWVVGSETINLEIMPTAVTVDPDLNCTLHGAHALGDYIWAEKTACGVVYWQWTFTAEGQLPITVNSTGTGKQIRLSSVAGLEPGESYDVSVAAMYPGEVLGPVSEPECISIIGPAAMAFGGPGQEPDVVDLEARNAVEPAAALYPNPTRDGLININLTHVEQQTILLEVRSMTGALVAQEQLQTAGGSVNQTLQLQGLTPGMYLVQFHLEGKTLTKRLAVQR